MSPGTSVALRLESISKSFGRTEALRAASLTVRRGTVHALLGENGAGKTTLMRIAYGLLRPDAGSIIVADQEVLIRSPADAIREGIGMVHQHFMNVPAMTVVENIALGSRGRFSQREVASALALLVDKTGLAIDPRARVSTLSIGAQQRLEILKALSRQARILIMDEPTAVLAPTEAADLLHWVRTFALEGGSVVLITHKLREALATADEITVLRYGRSVLAGKSEDFDTDDLARAMLGDAPPPPPATPSREPGDPVLRVSGLKVKDGAGAFRILDANLQVREGEILGVVALENSGHHLLLRAIAGREPPAEGTIERASTVALIPEDRLREAIILSFPLTENVALKGSGAARGRIRWRDWRARTERLVRDFDVRTASVNVPARTLSGGNQQKLVLARELGDEPLLVVAENPTRGLDLRAAREVHERLRRAAMGGAGVILYSSDLDEVLALATRIVAVHDGHVRDVPNDREAAGRAMLGLM
jgi:general nucleoside transport system ATP-binding protein